MLIQNEIDHRILVVRDRSKLQRVINVTRQRVRELSDKSLLRFDVYVHLENAAPSADNR